jgi:hypothetical protein
LSDYFAAAKKDPLPADDVKRERARRVAASSSSDLKSLQELISPALMKLNGNFKYIGKQTFNQTLTLLFQHHL